MWLEPVEGCTRDTLRAVEIVKALPHETSGKYCVHYLMQLIAARRDSDHDKVESSSIIPFNTSNPPCQKLIEAMSMSHSSRMFFGDSDPP